jgi:predicted PurR-regulated permease PerM
MESDRRYQKAYLLEHPIRSMNLAAVVLAILGLGLIFTAVGVIIGLPMLALAFLLAGAAQYAKHRHVSD